MAHYAEIDTNITDVGGYACNAVLAVIVISNDAEGESADPAEQEAAGLAWLASFGPTVGKTFRKTSYNANFRKNYAGPGMYFCAALDGFLKPYPGPGWTLNEGTCRWEQSE